jgi:MFS family permease
MPYERSLPNNGTDYGTVIFKATGINNSFVTQMILNGINFGVTPLGIYFVEAYGRRKCLIIGSAWMFVMFLCFASAGHFSLDRSDPQRTEGTGTGMIVLASLFILGFATTWGPMIWTICGELYPGRFRAKGMALSTASNWFWNFLLGKLYHALIAESRTLLTVIVCSFLHSIHHWRYRLQVWLCLRSVQLRRRSHRVLLRHGRSRSNSRRD